MRYLTRQAVALRALGRYIGMRSRRIGGDICGVVAHRRVDESSDVRDVGRVCCWLSLIFTRLTTVIKATLRTHEKMECSASITLIEKVSTVALRGFSSHRRGMAWLIALTLVFLKASILNWFYYISKYLHLLPVTDSYRALFLPQSSRPLRYFISGLWTYSFCSVRRCPRQCALCTGRVHFIEEGVNI